MNKGKISLFKKRTKIKGKFKVTVKYTTGSVKRNFKTLQQRDGFIKAQSERASYISHTNW